MENTASAGCRINGRYSQAPQLAPITASPMGLDKQAQKSSNQDEPAA
jgi:hypothetical protein